MSYWFSSYFNLRGSFEKSTNQRLCRSSEARARSAVDYTLVHAGRQVRLGPVAFWIAVGTLVIMAGWSVTTATYFAFREDVLSGLMSRQAEMQYGYEDRIAELRARLDRVSSRQLLDQEQFEQKLEQVLRRQSALESRSVTLSGFPDALATGSAKSTARPNANESLRAIPAKPAPVST